MSAPRLAHPDPGSRLLCAVGSVVLTGLLFGALLGLFDRSAPDRWLTPSAELMSLMASCQRLAGRNERRQCEHAAVLATTSAPMRQMAAAP
jgi:hypothetical protein